MKQNEVVYCFIYQMCSKNSKFVRVQIKLLFIAR